MKTDLLVVTGHPDDESMMAATMARYADEGKVVALVTATKGEGGGNGTGRELGPSLGIVREMELRACLSLLGAQFLYFLDKPDWAYTESVQATLAVWDKEDCLKRLVRLVRILRPEVIATMDPAPVGGQHGHHQAAGRLATEAFEAAADPSRFPEQLKKEGLAPWRVRKLYWVSFGGGNLKLPTDGVAKGKLAAMHPGKRYADIAMIAERNHRSQGFDKFLDSMASGQPRPARPESFFLVKSRVPTEPGAEKDLFDGIGRERATVAANNALAAQTAQNNGKAAVEARIQPGQPVRNYRDWLQANGISHLMARLPAHIPVTMGMASPVVVEVVNHTGEAQKGRVALEVPAGWTVDAAEKPFSVGRGSLANVTFTVTPPADAKMASHDVSARLVGASGPSGEGGKLDAVPQATIPRLARTMPVDADLAKWEQAGMKPQSIVPMPNPFGGETPKPSEISGRWFAGYTAEGMQVLVDVTDDTVVSNIAPDDIKGHWRSTSAEICIDPNPRAENTFSTLKLGIFPQDTAGNVRAGRDADANPGPVDEVEPGIRLASKMTPTGYIVEAFIPWSALRTKPGFQPRPGRVIGFNVILFHAGKKDAQVGEDVGKSRLAWSYWSGVWGRPVVWGTAILK